MNQQGHSLVRYQEEIQGLMYRLAGRIGRFVNLYITTMRPYLMFISGMTGITGMSLGNYVSFLKLALVGLASFLSYGFGQALTDCSQIDTDSISSPYRPLTRGLLTTRSVLMTSLVGLLGCSAIFIYYKPSNIFFCIAATIGLSTYTFFKRRWWAGPFYNSWIVLTLYFIALNCVVVDGLRTSLAILSPGFTVFFGYANFVLSGYFKDVEADRQTGYDTLPVRFGNGLSAYCSDLFALLMLLGAILSLSLRFAVNGVRMSAIPLFILVIGISFTLLGQIRLHQVKRDNEAYRAIVPALHGYVFSLLAIIIANQQTWLPTMLLYVTCYFVAIRVRPERSQI